MSRTALVALGGLIGSVARYWLSGLVHRLSDAPYPLGTLAVNVLGSFVLGLVMALSLERGLLGPNARLFLAVGLCGGFTTMSTFGYETMALVRDGQGAVALANLLATVVAGCAAIWLGGVLARVF